MRTLLLFLALVMTASTAALADTSVTAESRVARVTVYPDRAMVTRQSTINVRPGPFTVTFPDLPGEAVPDSVRVTGRGTAKVRLGTVETSRVFLEAAGKDEERKLQADLISLKDQDRALADEGAVTVKQMEFYQAIQFHNAEVWSKEITVGRLTVEDWAKVVGFLENGEKDAAVKAQAVEIKRRALKDRVDAIERRLAEMRSKAPRERLQARVEVEALSEGDLTLDISYIVMGASWTPMYEARADTDAGRVEMTFQGQVAQRTSEDWKAVDLSLSTARPAVGAAPPELPPWIVRLYEPVMLRAAVDMYAKKDKAAAPMPMEESEALAGGEGGAVNAPAPAEVMTAQAQEAGTSVVFKAMTKQDVPADGSAHKVTISVDTLKSDFEYFTVPKLAPYAFLKGFLVNDRDYPFLQGQASVFIGDDYLGKSGVPLTAPGEKLGLPLGMDDGIKVKRELVRRREEDTGLISKTRRITYVYKITLESYKKTVQKMTVLDQLPVSQQGEVVVKEVKLDPLPTERDEKGFLKWKIEVAPKEKKEIYIEFYVEFPRDRQVEGI